jgi:protein ImuB
VAADEAIAALVERLQARLGNGRVHGLAVAAEHRPGNASQAVSPMWFVRRKSSYRSHSVVQPASVPRPLWLLPQPQSLRACRPPAAWRPLQFLAGPERIKSGWWDVGEAIVVGQVRYNYFIVMSQCSEWLWICRSEAWWFLDGFFHDFCVIFLAFSTTHSYTSLIIKIELPKNETLERR